jgi:hypothetical protein
MRSLPSGSLVEDPCAKPFVKSHAAVPRATGPAEKGSERECRDLCWLPLEGAAPSRRLSPEDGAHRGKPLGVVELVEPELHEDVVRAPNLVF